MLYNFKTIQDIWMIPCRNVDSHEQTLYIRWITLACLLSKLSPFAVFQLYFKFHTVLHLNSKAISDMLTILGKDVDPDE